MEVKGHRFVFTFNPQNFHKQSHKVPPVKFTCQALANDTLAPHLKLCSKFLSYLQNRRDTIAFQQPVPDDPINIPDYYKIIKHPMDLSTIGKKVFDHQYPDLDSFKSDVDLIWSNCVVYNHTTSALGIAALRLKSIFDELWKLHISIDNPDVPLKCLELMAEALKISNDEFNQTNTSMQIFRMPPYMKLKIPQFDRIIKPIKADRERDDQNSYSPPPESLLSNPMTTKEKYELAVAIDTLPPELLGEVIEILSKTLDLRRDQEIDIPFSTLDNATLRTIEAYIKHAKEKEPAVRRMYQNETIPAEKQLEILKVELDRVDDQLRQKKAMSSSSEFTSENDTTDDASGESDASDSSDSATSGATTDNDSGDET